MNKQKYNLISSIISLSVTSLLLVFICLAWYSTNKNASVTGGSVGTAFIEEEDSESLVTLVEYYYVESISSSTYTIGDKIDGYNTGLEMGSYDALSGDPYHLLLKVVLGNSNLSITANINKSFYENSSYANLITTEDNATKYRFLGSTDSNNVPYYEIQHEDNPLSSIIGFYYITDVVDNQFTITDENQMATFSQKSGNTYEDYLDDNITIKSDTGEDTTVYILFAYEEGAIEDIYSANLGSKNLEPTEDETNDHWKDIEYICDFKISINKTGGSE